MLGEHGGRDEQVTYYNATEYKLQLIWVPIWLQVTSYNYLKQSIMSYSYVKLFLFKI